MWNLTFLAIVISVGWLALIAYYIILSRQQNSLQQELDDLENLLAAKEAQRALQQQKAVNNPNNTLNNRGEAI